MHETVNRRRREPSYRPIVLIENATARAVVRRSRRGTCRASSISRADPEVSGGDGGAPVRLRRRGHGSAAATAEYQGVEPGAVVGQAGVEKALNKLLMGTDGAKEVIVNSLGREIGKPLARGSADRGARACS